MSENAVAAFFRLVEQNPSRAHFVGRQSESRIDLAEEALGLRFPPSYRTFLETLGAGDIAGEEFFGIVSSNFLESGIPDSVWLTLRGRDQWSLPRSMVVVYFDGGTDYFALDTARPNPDGESPIVTWSPGRSRPGDDPPIVAADFGKFALSVATRALSPTGPS